MTKKPCPECGEVHINRKANEICYYCKKLIEEAKAFHAYFDVAERKSQICRIPDASHYFPYIRNGGEFSKALHRLACLISIPTRTKYAEMLIPGQEGSYDNTEESCIFPPGVPEALRVLHTVMNDVSTASY